MSVWANWNLASYIRNSDIMRIWDNVGSSNLALVDTRTTYAPVGKNTFPELSQNVRSRFISACKGSVLFLEQY